MAICSARKQRAKSYVYSEQQRSDVFFLSNYYPVLGQHGRPAVNSFIN